MKPPETLNSRIFNPETLNPNPPAPALDVMCMQAAIMHVMYSFTSATLSPGGCTHHGQLQQHGGCYDALWPSMRGSRERGNLADTQFFRLLSSFCQHMLEVAQRHKHDVRSSTQVRKC